MNRRVFSGNKNDIPQGLSPMEWAAEVWDVMDEQSLNQKDAKIVVAARYAKAEEQPRFDKMVKQSRNKGM
jgi:hypothetical protein